MTVYIEIFLIALALCFDTFAVSVSTGLVINHIKFFQAVKIAIVLAIIQAVMPLFGWLGGKQIEALICDYDHWISLLLLSIIGIKMIHEAFKEPEDKNFNPLQFKVVLAMAFATSIDALVLGVTFAFMKVDIIITMGIIGALTFLTSMIGVRIGKDIKGIKSKYIEISAGLILISIGAKMVLEHLSIL